MKITIMVTWNILATRWFCKKSQEQVWPGKYSYHFGHKLSCITITCV